MAVPSPPPPSPSPPPAADLNVVTYNGYNYVMPAGGTTKVTSNAAAQTACKAIGGDAFWFDTTDEFRAVTDALSAIKNTIGPGQPAYVNVAPPPALLAWVQFQWAFNGAVVSMTLINKLPWVSTYDINDPFMTYSEWQVISAVGVQVGSTMYQRSLESLSGSSSKVLCKVAAPKPSPSPPIATCKQQDEPCTKNADCCSQACNLPSPNAEVLACVPPYAGDRRRRRMLHA
ncbi:hypothetical protein COHA_009726 [Chlorella ohadii]|uniref:C-type lectin domain-containing protein n=1 Tax=Chlorella ohadii TaxID=2649997 RepID=A0AAD5DGK6_9CHLO|nr:hypothetical protein COHA_009726 [Chlorella ohadii]